MEQVVEDKTSQLCAACDKLFNWTEEVFLVQICRVQVRGNTPFLEPLLEVDGDYVYEPHWFHVECWESTIGELQEMIQDQLPVNDALSAISCRACCSGIRDQEFAGTALLGELHRSHRFPVPVGPGEDLLPSGPPDVLCIYCLYLINNSSIEMWADNVTQVFECTDCTQMRCWRNASCDCACHESSED